MRTPTFEQFSNEVLAELDMLEESFVSFDELVGYTNQAIDQAEAEIRKISAAEEDYFLTSTTIPLVSGTSEYDLPSDIYNRDIRRLIYHNGSDIYPVKRFRGKYKFENIHYAEEFGDGDDYRYYLKRAAADSQAKIILVPAARETSSTIMTCWYIRNARRIPLSTEGSEAASNATIIDIPEHIPFLKAYVKVLIKEKAKEDPGILMADLQTQRQTMIDTLSQFADDDDEIIPDVSHYMEST